MLRFVIVPVIVIALIIVSVTNSQLVFINLLVVGFQINLVSLVVICLLLGALLCYFIMVAKLYRSHWQQRALMKKVEVLERQLGQRKSGDFR